ncbi:MAG: hypothetical protein V3574_04155 [Candidatus Moraniibacteriota bacterium]
MSLHTDPKITINQIKQGKITGVRAITEVNNLIAEFTSGIFTLKQVGLRNFKELERLKKRGS